MGETPQASEDHSVPGATSPRWAKRVIGWLAGSAVIGLLFLLLGVSLVEYLRVRRATWGASQPSVNEEWVAVQLLAAKDLGLPRPKTIIGLLGSDKPLLRRGAALSLDTWPRDKGAADLKPFYADEDLMVRVPVLIAAADCGDAEALRLLGGLLEGFDTSKVQVFWMDMPEYFLAIGALADGKFREAGDDLAARIPKAQAREADSEFLMKQLEEVLSEEHWPAENRGWSREKEAEVAPALLAKWAEVRSGCRAIADFKPGETGWAGRMMSDEAGTGMRDLLHMLVVAEVVWLVGFWLVVLVRSRMAA